MRDLTSILVLTTGLLMLVARAPAQTETVLHRFTGSPSDGALPYGVGLIGFVQPPVSQ